MRNRWLRLTSFSCLPYFYKLTVPPLAVYKETILGKRIFTVPGVSTPGELRDFLRPFNLTRLLRSIGEISVLGARQETRSEIATLGALAHISSVAIEVASDLGEKIPERRHIERAAQIFHQLPEPEGPAEEDFAFEFLLRMGNSEFAEPLLEHVVTRSWLLYTRLWDTTPEGRAFPIMPAIEALVGIPYRKALMLGLAYSMNGGKGYTVAYPSGVESGIAEPFRFSAEEGVILFEWMSASYQAIRSLRRPTGSKYELSPLLHKPLVKPDIPPDGNPDIRLVPMPGYVWRKVTAGIYHGLCQANERGPGDNPFKAAFGLVFEAYVGELLRQGSGDAKVIPEFKYGPRLSVKSPDWLVLDGDTLLVIEVKQSALYLEAKLTGDLERVKVDLGKTLAKGAKQLLTFRDAVMNRTTGREDLGSVQKVSLLLVTQGDVPFGNFVLRSKIAEDLPDAETVQMANIEEFERLQEYTWGRSPFALLESKRSDEEGLQMDLVPWLNKAFGEVPPHPFLRASFDQLMAEMGVPRPISAPVR